MTKKWLTTVLGSRTSKVCLLPDMTHRIRMKNYKSTCTPRYHIHTPRFFYLLWWLTPNRSSCPSSIFLLSIPRPTKALPFSLSFFLLDSPRIFPTQQYEHCIHLQFQLRIKLLHIIRSECSHIPSLLHQGVREHVANCYCPSLKHSRAYSFSTM